MSYCQLHGPPLSDIFVSHKRLLGWFRWLQQDLGLMVTLWHTEATRIRWWMTFRSQPSCGFRCAKLLHSSIFVPSTIINSRAPRHPRVRSTWRVLSNFRLPRKVTSWLTFGWIHCHAVVQGWSCAWNSIWEQQCIENKRNTLEHDECAVVSARWWPRVQLR